MFYRLSRVFQPGTLAGIQGELHENEFLYIHSVPKGSRGDRSVVIGNISRVEGVRSQWYLAIDYTITVTKHSQV